MTGRALILALVAAGPAAAQDTAEDAFVSDNLIAIFYHEIGHALIDTLGLPIYGQEEIAADVASVILLSDVFTPDSFAEMAYNVPAGFQLDAVEEGTDPAFWDVHGAAEQRYYTSVCLFYGALPDDLDDYAQEMALPPERAETCADEFDLAQASWTPIFDELAAGPGEDLRLVIKEDGETADLIAAEVADLNDRFRWPDLEVAVLSCAEANAFYDPDARRIEICTEFADALRDGWRAVLSE